MAERLRITLNVQVDLEAFGGTAEDFAQYVALAAGDATGVAYAVADVTVRR